MENQQEFYKAILGPKNQDYYLRQFAKFDSAGQAGASWHWPAFFVTFYWFLYRKMWMPALLYFFLPYLLMVVLGIAGALAGEAAAPVMGLGYLLYVAAIFFVLPAYANALYYRQCNKKIAEVRASAHEEQRQLGELSGKGGTSNVVLIFVFIFAFVAVIGILAAIAIPAYQEYVTRARMAEAVSIGKNASERVADYYYQHQRTPESLAEAGYVAPVSPGIQGVSVNSQDGVVTITMGPGPVNGKTLQFVPSIDESKQIVWQCMSSEIQDRYLPQQCRQPK
ncbi:MAG: pilin [Gallionellaceae bacterium]|jgi:Tfp pilus assembly major pilin PilA